MQLPAVRESEQPSLISKYVRFRWHQLVCWCTVRRSLLAPTCLLTQICPRIFGNTKGVLYLCFVFLDCLQFFSNVYVENLVEAARIAGKSRRGQPRSGTPGDRGRRRRRPEDPRGPNAAEDTAPLGLVLFRPSKSVDCFKIIVDPLTPIRQLNFLRVLSNLV